MSFSELPVVVWVVGLVRLADTVVAELDRDWYVIEEEAVALIEPKLSLFVLADEVVDIRVFCVSSPLPPSKMQCFTCLV